MKVRPSLLEQACDVAGLFLSEFERRHWCFLQDDLSIANSNGATVRADINANLQAIGTLMAGTAAPTTTYACMWWADTTNGVLKQRDTSNTVWIVRGRLDATGLIAKASGYTVALGDFGKLIDATSGTWNLTLTAASTLGDGFIFGIRNSGSGVITVDPDSTEQIDGATTLAVQPGECFWIMSNGTLFRTIGRAPDMVGDTGTGGRHGLVPAPAAGDAAAGKYLKADGTWTAPSAPASSMPTGSIMQFAGPSAPDGWLLCYGQEVSRTTYSDLFGIIGTTYGIGNGSTTFNLPDCRGRVVAGKDNMGGTSANRLTNQTGGLDGDTLGANGGAETHALTSAQNAQHSHTFTGTTNLVSGANPPQGGGATTAFQTIGGVISGTIGNSGSGTAHNNVQPTIIFNTIIKT